MSDVQRKPKWRIILDCLLAGFDITVDSSCYRYLEKGQQFANDPHSDFVEYEALQTGVFQQCTVTTYSSGIDESTAHWVYCSDSITFFKHLGDIASEQDIFSMVSAKVLTDIARDNRRV